MFAYEVGNEFCLPFGVILRSESDDLRCMHGIVLRRAGEYIILPPLESVR